MCAVFPRAARKTAHDEKVRTATFILRKGASLMPYIEQFQLNHLPQVQVLVNTHMSALVPGWALPEAFIASHLQRDPGEYVVDPWVMARMTLCALERQRVVAVAHLLRYGSGVEVSPAYHNIGELAWFVAWPDAAEQAAALLQAAGDQFDRWGVDAAWALETSLPAGPFAGLPDAWPHVAAALAGAGYRRNPLLGRDEALFGGSIEQSGLVTPPISDLSIRRTSGRFGTRFSASLDRQIVGDCECISDLTAGGAQPALRGWGELAELEVREPWRNRGIGTWLVQHAAAWLRLGGCNRIVLSVADEDAAAGAARFYRRFGWESLVRFQRGWVLTHTQEHQQ
jgi:GNAT superfamily N-acetyltransferase